MYYYRTMISSAMVLVSLFSGIYCLIVGSLFLGIFNASLSIANLTLTIIGYRRTKLSRKAAIMLADLIRGWSSFERFYQAVQEANPENLSLMRSHLNNIKLLNQSLEVAKADLIKKKSFSIYYGLGIQDLSPIKVDIFQDCLN